jgi:hypothetical protein
MNSPINSTRSPLAIEDNSFWQNHFDLHIASGLTRSKYCKANNVNYDRFGYWLSKKYRPNSALIAVKIKPRETPSPSDALCTLNFRNGCSLKIHTTEILSHILEIMG